MSSEPMTVERFTTVARSIEEEIGRVIVGQRELVRDVLICLLSEGHALLEGVPGLAKTLLIKTVAQILDLSFKRIQFTPDLMPSDVTGGNVFNQQQDAFVFMPGPVFTQLLLADELVEGEPSVPEHEGAADGRHGGAALVRRHGEQGGDVRHRRQALLVQRAGGRHPRPRQG